MKDLPDPGPERNDFHGHGRPDPGAVCARSASSSPFKATVANGLLRQGSCAALCTLLNAQSRSLPDYVQRELKIAPAYPCARDTSGSNHVTSSSVASWSTASCGPGATIIAVSGWLLSALTDAVGCLQTARGQFALTTPQRAAKTRPASAFWPSVIIPVRTGGDTPTHIVTSRNGAELNQTLTESRSMAQTLIEILTEAIEDEYKARATYRQVLEEFGAVRPFSNIVEAEQRHIDALLVLFEKHDLRVPEDNWPDRVETPGTLLAACQAGVTAEIDNAAMYDRLLAASSDYPDVQRVLRNLQRASQENHLPAFQRCVGRESRQRR